MWADIMLVVVCGGAVAFLVRFEVALFRELRGAPKQWKSVSILRTDQPRSDEEPQIVLTFPVRAENSRVRQRNVGR